MCGKCLCICWLFVRCLGLAPERLLARLAVEAYDPLPTADDDQDRRVQENEDISQSSYPVE